MALCSSDWFAFFFVEASNKAEARALFFLTSEDGFARSFRSRLPTIKKTLSFFFLNAGSNISGIENHIAELYLANVKGEQRHE